MTKKELIERVAKTKGLPSSMNKKTVARLVDAVFSEMGTYFVRTKVTRAKSGKGKSATADNPRFTYPGFGTFTKKRREGRTGRDPQTGAPIEIRARTTVTFAPGVELKRHLNKT